MVEIFSYVLMFLGAFFGSTLISAATRYVVRTFIECKHHWDLIAMVCINAFIIAFLTILLLI